jgi:2-polyprenyl-3-methyl-5-hydroxy-6-metoxy-1,4-benzoquinol methylase
MSKEVSATRAKQYYDTIAKRYSEMITSGIGGAMKRKEKDCLMRLLSPRRGDRILDAGCGSGFYAKLILDSGAEVLCVDISPGMVDVVRRAGIDAEVQDVQSLNLHKEFDKILCAGPLEFCREPSRALQGLRKHLKKDGCIVLSVLNVSIIGLVYRIYHLSHGFMINLFSLRLIADLLKQTGFRMEVVERPTSFLYVIKARPL